MNRTLLTMMTATALLCTVAYAQKKKNPDKNVLPSKPIMDVVLGKVTGEKTGGEITEMEFDSVAPSGIRIRKPDGAFIEGFSFTYGERNVYEDSAGTQHIVTDYLTEYCLGDTLSSFIAKNIADRTKPGDTAYYDQIAIRMPNGKAAIGKPMKFVIIR